MEKRVATYTPANKRPVTQAPALNPAEIVQLPPWLEAMRSAMAVSPGDLSAIMSKQVEKAKAGDTRAAGFVVDQAQKMLAAEQKRPIAITQNNFYGEPEDPAKPRAIAPGGDSKVDLMRRRLAVGAPLTNKDDRDPRLVDDDEEEKRIRREQEQSESEAA